MADMPPLKALIFDVDGTLADTEEIHRRAFNLAFAEFELDWDWTPSLYTELLAISGGRERMLMYAERLGKRPKGDFKKLVATIHRVKTAHYAAMIEDGVVALRPGVRRLIEQCRDHSMPMAIATSSRYSNVDALLRRNLAPEWSAWFKAVGSCDNIDTKKPSPAVYDYVLHEMNLTGADCVAIEDTVNGNAAARAANLATIITTHYFTRQKSFPGASLVVNHLGEPDTPFTPSTGSCWNAQYVDLALIQKIQDERSTVSPAQAI